MIILSTLLAIGAGQSPLIVGLVLPFDRLLDMIRTTTNVVGNLTNATIMSRWTRSPRD